MRKSYHRARTDYPAGVLAVYDDGGKTCDRYTVVYEPFDFEGVPFFPFVTMSGAPFHPQGVCQHGEAARIRPTGGWGGTCGKVIRFEDLPEDCQKAVLLDLDETERFGHDGLSVCAQGRDKP